jgi:predicted MPP superfamily phosphohydrolase
MVFDVRVRPPTASRYKPAMLESLGIEDPFGPITLLGWLAVVGLAAARRGRMFATFAGVMLGVHALVSVALWPQFRAHGLGPLALALQLMTFVQFGALTFPRLRSRIWRLLVAWPGLWWAGATFLAMPWAIVAAIGLTPLGFGVPYAIGLIGLVQSLRNASRDVDLVIDREPVEGGPLRHPHGQARSARPLRIVQITDPHLGPFMSVNRLRRIAKRAVAADPDLILLTGDYLTMESQGTPGCLAEALAPLQALEGRVFACRGNHDLEAPGKVARELAQVGVRLLIDEDAHVQTDAGLVQIVGMDFRWRDRAGHAQEVEARCPTIPGALRIVLLHDPGAFAHLPDGWADLVLSGHTHGGQLGLVSLGLRHTAVSVMSNIPDHGFWARGRNRLYVHRATGHYGFPLRVGVPGEEGVLRVHVA